MKRNVLSLRTAKELLYDGFEASLWDGTETTKRKVYERKEGFLKRVIHLPAINVIVPLYHKANIGYTVVEKRSDSSFFTFGDSTLDGMRIFYPTFPSKDHRTTTYVKTYPSTVSIELKKEDASKCLTVKKFMDDHLIFWDKDYEKNTKTLKENEFIRVFANKQTHGVVMPPQEFIEKYGDCKVFCYLKCNSYYVESKIIHNIVLF
jgi:hypothetical protein